VTGPPLDVRRDLTHELRPASALDRKTRQTPSPTYMKAHPSAVPSQASGPLRVPTAPGRQTPSSARGSGAQAESVRAIRHETPLDTIVTKEEKWTARLL
jgi:hypothetical protein